MVSPFLKLFGRSPFKHLHQHMETAFTCVKTLDPFFEASIAGKWDEAETYLKKIRELEHHADDLKRDIRINLPKNLFLPVARSDLLELLSYQDYLANQAKDIAGLVFGRKMSLTDSIAPTYRELISISIESAKQAYKATRELNELLEAGFSGKEKAIIKEMLEKLHTLEQETDRIQNKIYQAIFAIEDDLPAVKTMFIYKLVDWTGALADLAEKVGDRLQICIAR